MDCASANSNCNYVVQLSRRKDKVVRASMDRLFAIAFTFKLIFKPMKMDVKAIVILENNMAYDATMTHGEGKASRH